MLGRSQLHRFIRPKKSCYHEPIVFICRRNYKANRKKDGFLDKVKDSIRRRGILIRGAMIRRRMFKLPFHSTPEIISYSDLCGHGAFVCLAVSYLSSDITYLRMSAVSGIMLSIIFQYYREKPLWIPIRWNGIFLITNIVLLIQLFKEANDADNLPEEQKRLFLEVFKDLGNMKMVDVLHLMMIANRKEFVSGSNIVNAGKKRTHLYIVAKGRCKIVNVKGDVVGEIGPNECICENAFVTWKNAKIKMDQLREKQALEKERSVVSLIYHDESNEKKNEEDAKDGGAPKESSWSGNALNFVVQLTPWLFTASETTLTEKDDKHFEDDAIFKNAIENDDSEESGDWQLVGKFNVVASEDVVVYKWRFDILHEMIQKRPAIGIVFERLVSKGLNNKMIVTASKEKLRNYKQMLAGAVMGDKVTARKRQHLADYREKYNVTMEDHNTMIAKLGWTPEDFEVGTKGVDGKNIVAYRNLVESFIGNDRDEISVDAKKELRNFRIANKIKGEDHDATLSRFNWNADEYEQGYKESYHQRLLQQQNQEEENAKQAAEHAASLRRARFLRLRTSDAVNEGQGAGELDPNIEYERASGVEGDIDLDFDVDDDDEMEFDEFGDLLELHEEDEGAGFFESIFGYGRDSGRVIRSPYGGFSDTVDGVGVELGVQVESEPDSDSVLSTLLGVMWRKPNSSPSKEKGFIQKYRKRRALKESGGGESESADVDVEDGFYDESEDTQTYGSYLYDIAAYWIYGSAATNVSQANNNNCSGASQPMSADANSSKTHRASTDVFSGTPNDVCTVTSIISDRDNGSGGKQGQKIQEGIDPNVDASVNAHENTNTIGANAPLSAGDTDGKGDSNRRELHEVQPMEPAKSTQTHSSEDEDMMFVEVEGEVVMVPIPKHAEEEEVISDCDSPELDAHPDSILARLPTNKKFGYKYKFNKGAKYEKHEKRRQPLKKRDESGDADTNTK